jgi:hypothetical protein
MMFQSLVQIQRNKAKWSQAKFQQLPHGPKQLAHWQKLEKDMLEKMKKPMTAEEALQPTIFSSDDDSEDEIANIPSHISNKERRTWGEKGLMAQLNQGQITPEQVMLGSRKLSEQYPSEDESEDEASENQSDGGQEVEEDEEGEEEELKHKVSQSKPRPMYPTTKSGDSRPEVKDTFVATPNQKLKKFFICSYDGVNCNPAAKSDPKATFGKVQGSPTFFVPKIELRKKDGKFTVGPGDMIPYCVKGEKKEHNLLVYQVTNHADGMPNLSLGNQPRLGQLYASHFVCARLYDNPEHVPNAPEWITLIYNDVTGYIQEISSQLGYLFCTACATTNTKRNEHWKTWDAKSNLDKDKQGNLIHFYPYATYFEKMKTKLPKAQAPTVAVAAITTTSSSSSPKQPPAKKQKVETLTDSSDLTLKCASAKQDLVVMTLMKKLAGAYIQHLASSDSDCEELTKHFKLETMPQAMWLAELMPRHNNNMNAVMCEMMEKMGNKQFYRFLNVCCFVDPKSSVALHTIVKEEEEKQKQAKKQTTTCEVDEQEDTEMPESPLQSDSEYPGPAY